MKFKMAILALVAILGLALVGCGGDKETNTTPQTNPTPNPGKKEKLTIWVGSESVAFYEEKLNEYAAAYKAENGSELPFAFDVQGQDTGAAADVFLQDTEAGADIFTVAHDNLGKLLEGSGSIAPFKSESLIEQMEEQNPDAFLDVCYLQAGDGSAAEYYGVPYISQALVLYYNKEIFDGKEDKLASWEGILEVAAENNAVAVNYNGEDGYNYSHFLLAQPYSEDAKAAFGNSGTLQIYKNGVQSNCYAYGDDQVAITKYAQRFTANVNGRNGNVGSTNWSAECEQNLAITHIGGAWNNGDVVNVWGEENTGITTLPTFTLTEADAYGKATAGMVFHSGSFADCKAFCKKKDSKYADYLDDIIEYLTTDEMQELSFQERNNLPASGNVNLGDDALAQAQVDQAAYGIAQPFGVQAKYNTYYYSKKAPETIIEIHEGTGYATDAEIIKGLQTVTFIWAKGKLPDNDAVLEEFIAGQTK